MQYITLNPFLDTKYEPINDYKMHYCYLIHGPEKKYTKCTCRAFEVLFFHEDMYRAGTDKTRFHVTPEYTTNKTLTSFKIKNSQIVS